MGEDMLTNLILLIFGFFVLIKGADFFIEGASGIAMNLGISKMLVGFTIIAFGTSAPELGVSIKAITSNNGEILFGNVIGSNIINILLILGITPLIKEIRINNSTLKKELPLIVIITILFGLLLLDRSFTRLDSLFVLGIFMVFLYQIISKDASSSSEDLSIIKSTIFTIVGLIGVILGSHTVVNSAEVISELLGVSERIISLTVIALGTSLPELVTSISAVKKEEYELVIGNILGSNIFNIGIVVALPILIFGKVSNIGINYIDIITMISAVIILFISSINDKKVTKKEGLLFLIIFIIYYSYVLS